MIFLGNRYCKETLCEFLFLSVPISSYANVKLKATKIINISKSNGERVMVIGTENEFVDSIDFLIDF